MKAIKYIFILLLVLVLGGSVYLSLQDGSYEFDETVIIDAPKELVYDQIANRNHYRAWNDTITLFEESSSSIQKRQDSTSYLLLENKSGDGLLHWIATAPSDQVRMELRFNTKMQETTTSIAYNLSELEDKTQLQLTAYGEKSLTNKLWSLLFGSAVERTIIPSLQARLTSIERIVKNNMSRYSVATEGIVNTSGGYHLYITQSASLSSLNDTAQELTGIIKGYMKEQRIEQAGSVFIQYQDKDANTNTAVITVAVPVREELITDLESRIMCHYKAPEKTVKITLQGAHKHLDEAWQKGLDFIAKNGLERSSAPIYEIYKNNPETIINPADLVTEVYLPIK